MVGWAGGFSGVGFTRDEFRKWLRSQPKPPYQRAVVHNTDAPYVTPPVAPAKRIANLANYYQSQLRWSGGPDFFVFGGTDKVYLGSPLGKSIGCQGWNGNSFHVEVEGQYTAKSKQDPMVAGSEAARAWGTMAWVFAEICDWMGWPVDGEHIKLHKEGRTTHDCPGALVKKEWFLARVESAKGLTAAPPVLDVTKAPVTLWVNTPGDTLNLRDAPMGKIKSTLVHGLQLHVLGGTEGWAHVSTPAGYQGWVSAKYLSPTPTLVKAPVPAQQPAPKNEQQVPTEPPQPAEPLFQPGQYKYSPFCVDWAKRFEGLRLKAYWDRNAWAIGYGHNHASGIPPEVFEDSEISAAEAVNVLMRDLDLQLHYVESYVEVPLTQGQVDALVLHIFQQGPGNFREGKVRPLVNAGKHAEAADMIKNWPTANAGLKRRRAVEAQIYQGQKPTKW